MKTIHVVTGPLYCGKSTYKRKLCTKLKTRVIGELQYGVDMSSPDCWEEISEYAKDNKTVVVETHLEYKSKFAGDRGAKVGKIPPVPDWIQMHFILPSADEVYARQLKHDEYTSKKGAQEEYDWYSEFAKQFDTKQKSVETAMKVLAAVVPAAGYNWFTYKGVRPWSLERTFRGKVYKHSVEPGDKWGAAESNTPKFVAIVIEKEGLGKVFLVKESVVNKRFEMSTKARVPKIAPKVKLPTVEQPKEAVPKNAPATVEKPVKVSKPKAPSRSEAEYAAIVTYFFTDRGKKYVKADYVEAFAALAPKFNRGGTLYRGISVNDLNDTTLETLNRELAEGTFEFEPSGYYGHTINAVSWTYDKQHAESFTMGGQGVLFTAVVEPKDVFFNIDDFCDAFPSRATEELKGEEEVLVDRSYRGYKAVLYDSGKPKEVLKPGNTKSKAPLITPDQLKVIDDWMGYGSYGGNDSSLADSLKEVAESPELAFLPEVDVPHLYRYLRLPVDKLDSHRPVAGSWTTDEKTVRDFKEYAQEYHESVQPGEVGVILKVPVKDMVILMNITALMRSDQLQKSLKAAKGQGFYDHIEEFGDSQKEVAATLPHFDIKYVLEMVSHEGKKLKVKSLSSFSGTEGCYASVVPLRTSVDKLRDLRNKLVGNIQGVLPLVDWHTTVIFSKDNVDAESIYDKIGVDPSIQFLAKPIKVEYWDGHKGQGVLVLIMKSDGLQKLHARFRRLGLTPTFDPYVPHMTLASDFNDPQLGKMMAASLTKSLDNTALEFCGLRVEDVS